MALAVRTISSQQSAVSSQQSADSRQQTADSRQQTADRQQSADSSRVQQETTLAAEPYGTIISRIGIQSQSYSQQSRSHVRRYGCDR